jgi:phage gp16-like protein
MKKRMSWKEEAKGARHGDGNARGLCYIWSNQYQRLVGSLEPSLFGLKHCMTSVFAGDQG